MKDPLKLYFTDDTFTKKALRELEEVGYSEAWAFEGGFKNRVVGLATIFKGIMDGSDHGKR